jgi:hypothetical protein
MASLSAMSGVMLVEHATWLCFLFGTVRQQIERTESIERIFYASLYSDGFGPGHDSLGNRVGSSSPTPVH